MANYLYRDLGIMLDLDNWQKLNDNFGDVATDLQLQKADYDAKLSTQQGEYNGKFGEVNARIDGIKEEISGEVLAGVITDASLIRQTPVDTFADLDTAYPTPETGWASMARDTGKVYRYNGTEWLEVEDIDPTAINEVDSRLTSQLAETVTDLKDRGGVNLRSLGAALDGVTDDYQIVTDALATYKNVVVPGDAVIATSNTIVVGQGRSFIGLIDNSRGYGKTATIKYIGPLDNKRAVVQVGKNAVGAEPALDGTDIQFKNFIVDANNLAGFGVYGTYLTNETLIDNIVDVNSLEYGQYIARAWYARFTRLRSLGGRGQGVALGMPLEYLDGTAVTWTTPSPLEVNNCPIDDIRAINCGKYFSVEFPGTFNPTDPSKRRKGYGIGFGVGNSFNATRFTSEKNGGVAVYCYTDFQPVKTISKGYLENNCLNSGLDPATTMAQMIIENVSPTGGNVYVRDVFMNYAYGGIYHTGVLGRKVWLENIQQPRFLKSLDGLTAFQLYAEVLKKSVYQDAGMYNTLESIATNIDVVQTIDTRNSFTVSTKQTIGYKLIFIKGDGTAPWGSFTLNYDDGTTASRSFPSGLGTSYVLATVANANLTSITKSGGTGGTLSNVTFKVVNTPFTHL
ncbi:hypothetical protein JY98_03825 [Exiguobacterium mexicanum]|nr:hypothetical protein JY98_03825 [Exiguobacterium mexicanum]